MSVSTVEQPVPNANPGPSIPVQLPDGSLLIRPDAGTADFGSLVNPGSLVAPSDQPLVMPPNSMSLSITNAAELKVAVSSWKKIAGGRQGIITGNGPAIFAEITKGGQPLAGSGTRFLMPDGIEIGSQYSSTDGSFTIRITNGNKTDKIRIIP